MLCGFVWPLEGMPYPWLRSDFGIIQTKNKVPIHFNVIFFVPPRELVWYLPQTAGMQVSVRQSGFFLRGSHTADQLGSLLNHPSHPGSQGHLTERLGLEQPSSLPGPGNLFHVDFGFPYSQLVLGQKQTVTE